MIINLFQRHCGEEEAEDSSSSEDFAGEEEEAVLTKKTKGLNKIMDLPSVRVLEPSKSLHYERSESNILWQAMASLGMKDMRPLDDKKTGNFINSIQRLGLLCVWERFKRTHATLSTQSSHNGCCVNRAKTTKSCTRSSDLVPCLPAANPPSGGEQELFLAAPEKTGEHQRCSQKETLENISLK